MATVRSLSFAVMIGLFAGSAWSQTASPGNPPPFPAGPPPGPPAGEIQLLQVRGQARGYIAPPDLRAAALPGPPAIGAMVAPQTVVEKDGVRLTVSSAYTRTFARFHVTGVVEVTDRSVLQSVRWTGPGRWGTVTEGPQTRMSVELDVTEPFVLKARPFRDGITGDRAKQGELSIQVDAPSPSTRALTELTPVAVATAMRTGGYHYELKLEGDFAKLPSQVLEAEWMLPEGFAERNQVSTEKATGYAVTGTFEREFPASVRVLFEDGAIGLGFVTVKTQ